MTDDAQMQSFLGRLEQRFEFTPDDYATKDALRDKLNILFGDNAPTLFPTPAKVDGLFNVADITKVQFPEVGINKIEFVQFGKLQTRFTVPFARGLFGFAKALELFKNL